MDAWNTPVGVFTLWLLSPTQLVVMHQEGGPDHQIIARCAPKVADNPPRLVWDVAVACFVLRLVLVILVQAGWHYFVIDTGNDAPRVMTRVMTRG